MSWMESGNWPRTIFFCSSVTNAYSGADACWNNIISVLCPSMRVFIKRSQNRQKSEEHLVEQCFSVSWRILFNTPQVVTLVYYKHTKLSYEAGSTLQALKHSIKGFATTVQARCCSLTRAAFFLLLSTYLLSFPVHTSFLSLFCSFVLSLCTQLLCPACEALPAHHPISHMPIQNGLTRHVNEWFDWVAGHLPNCCLQCVCACLYVCISGGSCDDAHSDGGNAGGGDGVAGGERGGAVDSLSSLFPLHLHFPHQRLLTLLSPGSRTAVGTVTCSCVVQYSVRACLFPYTIFTHHLPTGGGKNQPNNKDMV